MVGFKGGVQDAHPLLKFLFSYIFFQNILGIDSTVVHPLFAMVKPNLVSNSNPLSLVSHGVIIIILITAQSQSQVPVHTFI